MRISKEFSFDAAHILPHQGGKCQQLHGHTYRMIVSITANQPLFLDDQSQEGMLMDFGVLKEIVTKTILDEWDHKFLAKGDEWPAKVAPEQMKLKTDICLLGFRTTAENLSQAAAEVIFQGIQEYPERLDMNLTWSEFDLIVEVELFETPTSSATGCCHR